MDKKKISFELGHEHILPRTLKKPYWLPLNKNLGSPGPDFQFSPRAQAVSYRLPWGSFWIKTRIQDQTRTRVAFRHCSQATRSAPFVFILSVVQVDFLRWPTVNKWLCKPLQHPGTQRRKKLKSKHTSEINTKINSKSIKDLNIQSETVKLLEENMSRTLSNINHSKILHDPSPRVMKIKINKWDPIKFKSFWIMKEL